MLFYGFWFLQKAWMGVLDPWLDESQREGRLYGGFRGDTTAVDMYTMWYG